jgi:predicted alpha/beta-fold hydrolase
MGWRDRPAATTRKLLQTFPARAGRLYAVAHFRGCSGEFNHGPRAYHSGDFEEIDWILARFRSSMTAHPGRRCFPGRQRTDALGRRVGAQAACVVPPWPAVCAPLDLAASGHAIGRGFNRLVYTRHVPAHHETQGPAASWHSTRACSTRDALRAGA